MGSHTFDVDFHAADLIVIESVVFESTQVKIAIEFAIAAAAQPNAVTDELFARMKQHWSEGQIVEITAVVAHFGFMNRWNDTMATELEEASLEEASGVL